MAGIHPLLQLALALIAGIALAALMRLAIPVRAQPWVALAGLLGLAVWTAVEGATWRGWLSVALVAVVVILFLARGRHRR